MTTPDFFPHDTVAAVCDRAHTANKSGRHTGPPCVQCMEVYEAVADFVETVPRDFFASTLGLDDGTVLPAGTSTWSGKFSLRAEGEQ